MPRIGCTISTHLRKTWRYSGLTSRTGPVQKNECKDTALPPTHHGLFKRTKASAPSKTCPIFCLMHAQIPIYLSIPFRPGFFKVETSRAWCHRRELFAPRSLSGALSQVTLSRRLGCHSSRARDVKTARPCRPSLSCASYLMGKFIKQFVMNVQAKCPAKSSGVAIRSMFSVICQPLLWTFAYIARIFFLTFPWQSSVSLFSTIYVRSVLQMYSCETCSSS